MDGMGSQTYQHQPTPVDLPIGSGLSVETVPLEGRPQDRLKVQTPMREAQDNNTLRKKKSTRSRGPVKRNANSIPNI